MITFPNRLESFKPKVKCLLDYGPALIVELVEGKGRRPVDYLQLTGSVRIYDNARRGEQDNK